MSIFKKRDEALKLAREKYQTNNPVSKYGSIYIASTSNVTATMKLYKNYNKVLAVGATGAHGYEAALNGATKVDMFDINELQKIYYEYMKVAIMYLDYETFIKHFTLKTQSKSINKTDLEDLLSLELYFKLCEYLDDDVKEVLTTLYSFFDGIDLVCSNLFRIDQFITLDYLKRNISFYNEEYYYKLQRILKEGLCEINYKTVSLSDIINEFNDKYDVIILDNILQYYKQIPDMNEPYSVNMFLHKKLSNLLTDEGVIQASYGFEVASLAFKEKFNILYDKEKLNYIQNQLIKKEMKEGINIPLFEKWDNYDYSFIPAVEEIEGRNFENLVLTYKRNNSKFYK